jgi:hypothetical protein
MPSLYGNAARGLSQLHLFFLRKMRFERVFTRQRIEASNLNFA